MASAMAPEGLSLFADAPDKLSDICLKYVANHISVVAHLDRTKYGFRINDDVILPEEISERLLSTLQQNNPITDEIACMFSDHDRARLKIIKLNGARITDKGFRYFMENSPISVELSNCESISMEILEVINNNSKNLVYLKLGPATICHHANSSRIGAFVINAPKLRTLIIHQRHLSTFPLLLCTSTQLTHLDLSECNSAAAIKSLNAIPNLLTLILYNVHWLKDIFSWILKLHSLRHLDVCQCDERHGKFVSPSEVMEKLIKNLPHLEYLDISGTNLAGTGSTGAPSTSRIIDTDDYFYTQEDRCDIPGMESRVRNPLKFLGLYSTLYGASKRHDIPSLAIAGDSTEQQILTAAGVYMERPAMMMRVLNDLYYMFRNDNVEQIWTSLAIVLEAMEKHTHEKHIQIAGSASLFYVVKGKEKQYVGYKLRKRIIKAVLVAMESHPGDDTMLRNCCLTLCQFNIPKDVLFVYERVVITLLNGVADVTQETFVQRIVIYLLNSLACQVDRRHKQFLGDYGAVGHMLLLISDRLERRVCDDVLEVAWSTMWNVTDETPHNCQRFLENKGMDYFLSCLQNFPDKAELLRNMMGLLGNVAEVPQLRPRLMGKLFLSVFYQLLDSTSDGIEVSYNAAGVLSHMASDGYEAWTVDDPLREAVLARIETAVERWDLLAERNINYRSFEPILRLLHSYHTPQCQHWAVWALANLTTVYPAKYCNLLEDEGGITMLNQLLIHPSPYLRIKQLARMVLDNCARFEAGVHPAANNNVPSEN